MKTIKHTPGPWKVVKTENKHRHVIYSGVCKVTEINTENSFHDGIGLGEGLANARLIAAAPELLAALEGLLECSNPTSYAIHVESARGAIAKARGEA